MMNHFYKISLALSLVTLSLLASCTGIRAPTPVSPLASVPVPKAVAGQVKANGISIAYERFGAPDDETTLLIGGTGMQLVDWPLELVTALVQRGYQVVRFDNRDIGRSTKLTEAGL